MIERRLDAVFSVGIPVVIYNPRSHGRPHNFALAIEHARKFYANRPGCSRKNALREGQADPLIVTLGEIEHIMEDVDMHTTVIIGGSESRIWRMGNDVKGIITPRGTTASTYIDPGATTPEAYEMSKTSRVLARKMVGDQTPDDRVRQRCSVAVGDFAMAGLLRFNNDPVTAALGALKGHAPVITDIRMVQVGIQKKGHHSEILCALDFGDGISRDRGIARKFRRVYSAPDTGCGIHCGDRERTLRAAHGLRHDQRRDTAGGCDRYTGRFCQRSGIKIPPADA